jgi:hypothetical protein
MNGYDVALVFSYLLGTTEKEQLKLIRDCLISKQKHLDMPQPFNQEDELLHSQARQIP